MTNPVSVYYRIFVDIMKLALPVIAGHFGHVLTGVTDVFVAAKDGLDTLASVAIANSILFTIFIIGIGINCAISILISNARGAGRPAKNYMISTACISQIFAAVFCLICLSFIPLINFFGFEENLLPGIKDYMFIVSFSLFGMYLYQALKEFLQAYEMVAFPNFMMGLSVIANLILNFIFVFGLGSIISPMGIKGLAYATLIVRSLMGIILFLYCLKVFSAKYKMLFSPKYFINILKTGFPIGFGLLAEFLGFNVITVALAKQSGLLAATHNVLVNLSGIFFTVPLGISGALSVKVGFYNGAKNYIGLLRYSIVGVISAGAFQAFCGLLFLIFPVAFINIFTDNPDIIKTALPAVIVIALFQLADGVQISLGGVLKGLKKTKEVSMCVIGSYWLLGIPAGFLLAYGLNMTLKGFWTGIAISLILIAILEYILTKKELKKIRTENALETV